MKRLLFVDEAPSVEAELQQAMPRDWEATCVSGVAAAQARLAESRFDLIVADVRVPGGDGTALLQYAREHYPHMVRVMLSGYVDRDSALRAVPVAHQFVAKPCDAATLRDLMDRASALADVLRDPDLQRVVGQIGELPSCPRVYTALSAALADPDTSISDVVAIIEQDMALAARCVQLANSAYFGLARHTASIHEAILYLGLDTVKSITLSAAIGRQFSVRRVPHGLDAEQLQRHALLAAGLVARLLPERSLADYAVTAALVHDIGILVLASCLPEQFERIARLAQEQQLTWRAAEQACLGVTHAELGAYLLGLWGLPPVIVRGVAQHHALPTPTDDETYLATALYLADHLAAEQVPSGLGGTGILDDELDLDALGALGWTGSLPAWRALVAELVGGRPAA
ncbi:MAG TPA: response regulator [Chloroflexota bacterium]|nr:response regulator [Chloroflexota bacterium]